MHPESRASWDEIKEKEYLEQMRELYKKTIENESFQEKIDVNGIKVSKKLFNRDSLKHCSVCSSRSRRKLRMMCIF